MGEFKRSFLSMITDLASFYKAPECLPGLVDGRVL